jgi:hypothetical protein
VTGKPTWYERWPARFAEERHRLEALGFRLDAALLCSARTVSFCGEIAHADRRYGIEVQFPAGFPELPPQVYGPGFLLPRHQDPATRNMCVLGHDDWQPSMTAGDLVVRAQELVATWGAGALAPRGGEGDGGDDEWAPEPRSASYPYTRETCILVPPQLLGPPPGTRGTFRAALDLGPSIAGTRGVLLEAASDAPSRRLEAGEPWCLMYGGRDAGLRGLWFRAHEPPPPTNDLQLFNDWAAEQGFAGLEAAARRRFRPGGWPHGPVLAAVYPDEAGASGQGTEYWLFAAIAELNGAPRLELLRAYPVTVGDRAGRVPFLGRLAGLTVTAVGLGAVGSQVAVELARCGVGRFNLVDPDTLEPGNLVRHAGGLSDVGRYKVAAVARRILEHNPLLDPNGIRLYPVRVGHRQDQLDAFTDLLPRTDLLVSTTADGAVDRLVNALCLEHGVPAVYAWVSGGAWGGRAFRVIPGETGCYECAGWTEGRRGFEPPLSAPRAAPHYDVGCWSPTFSGAAFDVGVAAQFAARLAVQTLLRPAGASGEAPYPKSPGHQVVFNLRQRNGAAAFATRFLPLPRDPRCTTCGRGAYGRGAGGPAGPTRPTAR